MTELVDDQEDVLDLNALSPRQREENDVAREEKMKLQFQRFHQLQQTRRQLSDQGVEGLNDEVLIPVFESRSRLKGTTNKSSPEIEPSSSTSAPLTPRALKRYLNAANSKPHAPSNGTQQAKLQSTSANSASLRLVVRRKKQRRTRNSTLELTSDEDTNKFDNNRDGVYRNSEERQALHQQTTPYMRSSFEALYDPRLKRVKMMNNLNKDSSTDEESVREENEADNEDGEDEEEVQRSLQMGLPKEKLVGAKKVSAADLGKGWEKNDSVIKENGNVVDLEPEISEMQTLYDEKGKEVGSAKQLRSMKLENNGSKSTLLFTALGEPAGVLYASILSKAEEEAEAMTADEKELINQIAVLLHQPNQNEMPLTRQHQIVTVSRKKDAEEKVSPSSVKDQFLTDDDGNPSKTDHLNRAFFNSNILGEDSVFDYDGRFIGTANLLYQGVGTEKMDFHEELFDSFGEKIGMIHATSCFTKNSLEKSSNHKSKDVFTFDLGTLQCNDAKSESKSFSNVQFFGRDKIMAPKSVAFERKNVPVNGGAPLLLERSLLLLALDGEHYFNENSTNVGSLRRIIATQNCNENTRIFNRKGQLVGSINNLLNRAHLSYFMKIYDHEKKFLGLLNELVRKNYLLKKSDSKQKVYDSFGNQVGIVSDLQYGIDSTLIFKPYHAVTVHPEVSKIRPIDQSSASTYTLSHAATMHHEVSKIRPIDQSSASTYKPSHAATMHHEVSKIRPIDQSSASTYKPSHAATMHHEVSKIRPSDQSSASTYKPYHAATVHPEVSKIRPTEQFSTLTSKPLRLQEEVHSSFSSVTNESHQKSNSTSLSLNQHSRDFSDQKPNRSYVYNAQFQKDTEIINKPTIDYTTSASPPAIPQRHIGPMVRNPNIVANLRRLKSKTLSNGQTSAASTPPQIPKRSISLRKGEPNAGANSNVKLTLEESGRNQPQRTKSLLIKQGHPEATIAPVKSIHQTANATDAGMDFTFSSTHVNSPARPLQSQRLNEEYMHSVRPVLGNLVQQQQQKAQQQHPLFTPFTESNSVTLRQAKEGFTATQFPIEENNPSNRYPQRQRPASTHFDERSRTFSPTSNFYGQPIDEADSPYMYLPRAQSQLTAHAADGYNRSLSPAAQRYEQRIAQRHVLQQQITSPIPSVSQQMLSAAARLQTQQEANLNHASSGRNTALVQHAPLRYSTPEASPERSTLGGPDWVSTSRSTNSTITSTTKTTTVTPEFIPSAVSRATPIQNQQNPSPTAHNSAERTILELKLTHGNLPPKQVSFILNLNDLNNDVKNIYI